MNKDVYETDVQNNYNLIVGQTNEQLKDKSEYDCTFQEANTGQYPIVYLMTLEKLCFLKNLNNRLSGLYL